MTNLKIEMVRHSSPALLRGVKSLLPQLTSSDRTMTATELNTMITSPTATLLIVRDSDKIVGMISLAIVQMPSGLRSYLEDLVINSSYRRRGAATKLLEAAIDLARNAGVRTLDFTSRPSRIGTIELYERLGFRRRETNVFRYTFDE